MYSHAMVDSDLKDLRTVVSPQYTEREFVEIKVTDSMSLNTPNKDLS